MRVFVEDQKDQEEIERLIKQRQIVKRILMLLKQIRDRLRAMSKTVYRLTVRR